MNYLGSYHADIRTRGQNGCDAPLTVRGRMAVSAVNTASTPDVLAMVHGRITNKAKVAKTLGVNPFDAEAQIVLAAYLRWGAEYVEYISGPFVSCIADVPNDRMILMRDRMGECSFYYAYREGQLVFSDHPDTILRTGFIKPVLTQTGACELFGMGPAKTPGITPLDKLFSLKPGHMLICENGTVKEKQYFAIETLEHEDSPAQTADKVRFLIEKAVGDVVHLHPACMLSGGLDSTALTAVLCRKIGRVDSFSVDYVENTQDFVPDAFRPEMDGPYARLAAQFFGTRHKNILIGQEMLCDTIDKAVRARGFAGMADIDASLLLFAQSIIKDARYVVSGECGDEVFGGYPWFRGEAELPECCFPWSGSMDLRASVLRREVAQKIDIGGYVQRRLHEALDSYDVNCVGSTQEKTLFKLQRLCFDFFMPNLQERAVKMCEAVGLCVLTPFCDADLAQYVYNVPWSIKTEGSIEKSLLRTAVKDLLPEKLLRRRKSPYPKTCSARYTQLVRARVKELIRDENAPLWKLADRQNVERIAGGSLDPAAAPWFGQLMAGPQMLAYLLQVNNWLAERGVEIDL